MQGRFELNLETLTVAVFLLNDLVTLRSSADLRESFNNTHVLLSVYLIKRLQRLRHNLHHVVVQCTIVRYTVQQHDCI